MECLRLRVKDVDFARNEITVRDGKGGKDRRTMLPRSLIEPLQREQERARLLHGQDLATGFGETRLPHVLARKYPNAAREFGWQFVFPSLQRSIDPLDGAQRRHHFDDAILARALKRAHACRHRKAGQRAHAAAFVCHAPDRGRLRHPHGPGTARSQGRVDHADLHACIEPRRPGCAEPARPRPGAMRFRKARHSSILRR